MSEDTRGASSEPLDVSAADSADATPSSAAAESSADVDGSAEHDIQEPGLIRFVGLAVPIVVLVVLYFVVRSSVDFADLLPDFFEPPMAEFHGRVFYNDEPVEGAMVEAKPLQKGRRGGIAFSEPDGRFQMMTDINGAWVKKVFFGDYQLKVAAYGRSQGPSPPPRLTPQKYNSYDASGLTIHVTQDVKSNTVEIRMVD